MRLKIPPPLVALIVIFCMWYLNSMLHQAQVQIPYSWIAALLLAAAGILIAMAGIFSFRRKETTVNPLAPEKASSLVDEGVYEFTRNPMYLGLLLGIIAWAVLLSNWLTLIIFSSIFVVYMNLFQIRYEEEALESIFGEQYLAYKSKVRRWI